MTNRTFRWRRLSNGMMMITVRGTTREIVKLSRTLVELVYRVV